MKEMRQKKKFFISEVDYISRCNFFLLCCQLQCSNTSLMFLQFLHVHFPSLSFITIISLFCFSLLSLCFLRRQPLCISSYTGILLCFLFIYRRTRWLQTLGLWWIGLPALQSVINGKVMDRSATLQTSQMEPQFSDNLPEVPEGNYFVPSHRPLVEELRPD